MDRIVYTKGELEAYRLVYGGDLLSTESDNSIIESADRIIQLAEQIKSERARAAINCK